MPGTTPRRRTAAATRATACASRTRRRWPRRTPTRPASNTTRFAPASSLWRAHQGRAAAGLLPGLFGGRRVWGRGAGGPRALPRSRGGQALSLGPRWGRPGRAGWIPEPEGHRLAGRRRARGGRPGCPRRACARRACAGTWRAGEREHAARLEGGQGAGRCWRATRRAALRSAGHASSVELEAAWAGLELEAAWAGLGWAGLALGGGLAYELGCSPALERGSRRRLPQVARGSSSLAPSPRRWRRTRVGRPELDWPPSATMFGCSAAGDQAPQSPHAAAAAPTQPVPLLTADPCPRRRRRQRRRPCHLPLLPDELQASPAAAVASGGRLHRGDALG
jgi:hypothetical protein